MFGILLLWRGKGTHPSRNCRRRCASFKLVTSAGWISKASERLSTPSRKSWLLIHLPAFRWVTTKRRKCDCAALGEARRGGTRLPTLRPRAKRRRPQAHALRDRRVGARVLIDGEASPAAWGSARQRQHHRRLLDQPDLRHVRDLGGRPALCRRPVAVAAQDRRRLELRRDRLPINLCPLPPARPSRREAGSLR